MLLHPFKHHPRQIDESISAPGIDGGKTVGNLNDGSSLAFNTKAASLTVPVSAPSLAPSITITTTALSSTPASTSSSSSADATNGTAVSTSGKSDVPVTTVVAACVGSFVGLVVVICLFVAWYKRMSDKTSTAARRNAARQIDQQRARTEPFNRLSEGEKSLRNVTPRPSAREQQESDEKNFSMFKKSPSVRTAYTHKTTTEDEHAYDLPELKLSYPTLSEELALKSPQKPFAVAARQDRGVSWDGDTLGDDSFLSMRSVRVDSGTMSPTMVVAKMTPPATASGSHRWESAEVLHADEEPFATANSSRDFTEAGEEPRSRATNPFFNAQDMHRSSRIGRSRSRSNSRTSRTSRAQSLVRSDSRATQHTITPYTHANPFLDQEMSTSVFEQSPDSLQQHATLPDVPPVPSFRQDLSNSYAMASLIAALDLTREELDDRSRVVSMQGSTLSAYSENESDIATVRQFPMPPGTNGVRSR